MQRWVYDGVEAYSKRMPAQIQMRVTEIQAGLRSARGAVEAARDSSMELANEMRKWMNQVPHVAILIGGPDGLTDACKNKVDRLWSLSKLTLPHGLVRVVLAEQLYRAWTILQGHPYHRS